MIRACAVWALRRESHRHRGNISHIITEKNGSRRMKACALLTLIALLPACALALTTAPELCPVASETWRELIKRAMAKIAVIKSTFPG